MNPPAMDAFERFPLEIWVRRVCRGLRSVVDEHLQVKRLLLAVDCDPEPARLAHELVTYHQPARPAARAAARPARDALDSHPAQGVQGSARPASVWPADLLPNAVAPLPLGRALHLSLQRGHTENQPDPVYDESGSAHRRMHWNRKFGITKTFEILIRFY